VRTCSAVAFCGSGANGRLEANERYLRRAIRNECFSMLKQRAKRRQIHVGSDAVLERIASTDSEPDERLALERGIRLLTPEQRETVHLHVFDGLTFKEIAETSGASLNTVAARYRCLGKAATHTRGREKWPCATK
jgi:DNA-directed RNA polymerase specialized sigma24 family protein